MSIFSTLSLNPVAAKTALKVGSRDGWDSSYPSLLFRHLKTTTRIARNNNEPKGDHGIMCGVGETFWQRCYCIMKSVVSISLRQQVPLWIDRCSIVCHLSDDSPTSSPSRYTSKTFWQQQHGSKDAREFRITWSPIRDTRSPLLIGA